MLRRYLGYLATRRYAPRSVARKASALRRWFAWLTRTGVIEVDPAASLSAPSGAGRLPRVLKDRELDALLDGPASRPAPGGALDEAVAARDQAVLELLYGSGLRVGELCGLRTGDLELGRGLVRVWGKGGKQRLVPLSDPSVDALRRWLDGPREQLVREGAGPSAPGGREGAGPDAVFLNMRGRTLTPGTCAGCSTGERSCPPIPTPCGTPSPPTFSTGAPTCAPCRSCSVTPISPRPRSTRT